MKKLLLFAFVAGLGLVSASPPPKSHDPAPREAGAAYPPCSRTVTDRCNQLRGQRGQGRQHAEHRGRRDHHAHRGHRDQHAHRDHRHHARHHAGRGGGHAMRAPAAAHRRLAHRVRRAGERG